MHELKKMMEESIAMIRSKTTMQPTIGIILGSGLGDLADRFENKTVISTADIPHYAKSTVEGHDGKLVFGTLNGKHVLAVKGRVHYYEGYTMAQVTYVVRLMGMLGIRSLIVTNAAGGVNPLFQPGDLMFITSHINFFFANPLQGPNDETIGPRFPDMESEYDREYISIAEKTALKLGVRTQRGVYCAGSGPTYETRAEVKMFQKIGADAVGMSTVPEVIVAKHQNMRVLGISCITNLGTGISQTKLSHEEVTETANRVKTQFQQLITDVVGQIG
ncbi:purine-nucleoside phosphorylase [bacterium]|nr:purine-nucleoside phosphorylase [bacterium]NUN44544.1 purine-nucleoside phosphorylase [bacterium]